MWKFHHFVRSFFSENSQYGTKTSPVINNLLIAVTDYINMLLLGALLTEPYALQKCITKS
jgi:hypothetical protein